MDKFSFYEILNASVSCSMSEITGCFRKLAVSEQPSRLGLLDGINAELIRARFLNIWLAYFILRDEETRSLYDSFRSEKDEEREKKLVALMSSHLPECRRLADLKYPEYINDLKNKYSLLSDIAARTAKGIYLQELDEAEKLLDTLGTQGAMADDINFIDMARDIFLEFGKISIIIIVFALVGYILALIKIFV